LFFEWVEKCGGILCFKLLVWTRDSFCVFFLNYMAFYYFFAIMGL
jgi:hypothetical protein